MLTPRFEITQSDEEVSITIHAPYANIKDTEVYVQGCDFRFFSSPYYLRLNLPGEIEENDASTGNYDCDKGDFSLCFSKINKGEFFENLDMISSLLLPSTKSSSAPTIEVLSSTVSNAENEEGPEEEESVESEEWFIPQNVPSEHSSISLNSAKYGFANKVSEAFGNFEDSWLSEVIDIPQPDKIPADLRKSLREEHEESSFNIVHYIAEYLEPEQTEEYIKFKADWEIDKTEEVAFNSEEIDILKELPNKEYLLDAKEISCISLGLVDILFGFCYNHRTTLGENTVESGWTIAKISSTLSWFQNFSELKEVLIAGVRRSLCFPLYRNWNLSMKILEDVKQILKLGKKSVIKKFCEVHTLFNASCEPRYVLNQLYIKDYLIWIQQSPESILEELVKEFNEIKLEKEEIGFDLIAVEKSAYDIYVKDFVIENEGTDDSNLMDTFENLTIKEKPIVSVTSSSSDSDSDSDSTSSSSSSSSNENYIDNKNTEAVEFSNNSAKCNYSSRSSKSLDSDDCSEPEEK